MPLTLDAGATGRLARLRRSAAGKQGALTRMLAFSAVALFLATSFRMGWERAETDFPNYYTAAVLAKSGAPLESFYNWPWFQEQMDRVGVENQLGGYIPQTPLTMLPMVPIAQFPVQTAKRIWLVMNLVFLAAIVWVISRMTELSKSAVWLLAMAGFGALHANFLLGQYYVFLLLLLVLGFYFLNVGKEAASGILFGAAFALKLYGAPFVLYFAAMRRWRAVVWMTGAAAAAVALAVLLFGWHPVGYFATQILPRALAGETLDPYHPSNNTLATLLRRAFVREPELNLQPLCNAPWLFFFLQPFLTVLILAIPLLSLRKNAGGAEGFAWFCIALVLASPNTASYTFVLLLLPVALLFEKAGMVRRVMLIGCYLLLTIPMRPGWSFLFPRVWLLLLLYLCAGYAYWPHVNMKWLACAAAIAAGLALPVGWFRELAYLQEPGQRWERVSVQPGAIYSSSPTVLRSGIVYESIGSVHYVLRWLHGTRNEEFDLAGDAFHPAAAAPDGPVLFELVTSGRSEPMQLDMGSRRMTPAPGLHLQTRVAQISPDGKWAVSTKSDGSSQVWLQSSGGGPAVRLTGGHCNSFSAVWELDSKAILFASDCSRGIGLPALYRARLDQIRFDSVR